MKILNSFLIICLIILCAGCQKEIKVINSPEEFLSLIDNKIQGQYQEAISYDLRSEENCANGHIAGFVCIMADNISLEEVYDNIVYLYSKKTYIFLIDDDGKMAADLAEKLFKNGYRHIYYYQNGYQQFIIDNPGFIPEVGCEC